MNIIGFDSVSHDLLLIIIEKYFLDSNFQPNAFFIQNKSNKSVIKVVFQHYAFRQKQDVPITLHCFSN